MQRLTDTFKPFFKQLASVYFAIAMLIVLVMIAIVVYVVFEGYSLVEAFYMTIITISTVGYEEVKPLSSLGMVFTSLLIILSFGIFGYTITSLTKYVVDGEFRQYLKIYKENKLLMSLDNHVIVCGYGRNGWQATHELIDHGEMVVVIEKDDTVIDEIARHPNLIHIRGNAIHEEVLDKARVDRAKALITTLPGDADNLFVVLTAREMNQKMTIISRASDQHSDKKLIRAGANNVIMPDKVGGSHMAKLVAEPDVVEFLDAILLRSGGHEVNISEISCEKLKACFMNKTIGELEIRKNSGANLIGMKTEEGSYIFNPAPDVQLFAGDKLFALGTRSQLERLKNVLEGIEEKK